MCCSILHHRNPRREHEFPAVVTSPVTENHIFLGGAGERGLTINGTFIKFTCIGVYLEDKADKSLATKWEGKLEELLETLDFYRDIISGPFEKLIRRSKIKELSGPEYSRKVMENCVAHLKSVGTYGDAEVEAIQNLQKLSRMLIFHLVLLKKNRQSPDGILGLSSSKDISIPEKEDAIIENKAASSAVLETMIGEHAVSPDLKRCLAARLPALLNEGTFKIGN
uniref:Chalcone--flavanone isomerase n=1 Tax=Pisum sativum TaxID=3888 RepID=CFI_PEA|nr:RecName: Full=Chalcone--flavanone isomerase; Short=Chalcone isomerase [Pisum sativum]AAA50174.1 chalcone isomerase [Pisum sativum]